MTDRTRLYAAAFVRALATGMGAIVLGVYLARLGLSSAEIGVVVGAGLAGMAAATFGLALGADRIGRRRTLIVLALLAALGGVTIALAPSTALIAAAAFAGMMNGMGRDRSASAVIDQAILPATASDAERTRVFAWYNVLQDAGHALGGLLAGLPALLEAFTMTGALGALRWTLALYGLLLLATAALYAGLSPAVEDGTRSAGVRVTPQTRTVLWRISSLFAIDSLAGGFLTSSLLTLFFFKRFGVETAGIGLLFAAARVANALSHIAAAWLARRIGLVNTMVFTHIPSSLLLVTVPLAPTFPIAAILFLVREGLVEMDVPTRQSYVMAVVRPEERTVAAGITQLVRTCGWAAAPSFAGLMMQGASLALPLYVGAAMKISYDILLYLAFRKVKPPEEV